MPYVVTALCHGKKNQNVARYVQGSSGEENNRGRQETVATQCGSGAESEAMNTAHHRREVEAAVAKLFDGVVARSCQDEAILKLAAAVQAIIVEIEQSRSR